MRETFASVLCDSPSGSDHFDAAPRRQRRGEFGGVQRADGGIGDQQDVARGHRPVELGLELHGAGADEDRIAALAQIDVNSLHVVQ